MTLQKINSLYKGSILLPNKTQNFINLSDHELTEQQKEFLNLGPNCHLFGRYNHQNKKAEIELLFENIVKLETEQHITTHPGIKDLLKAEAIKNRYDKKQKSTSILTHNLKKAAHELQNHPNIIVKKADKTNIYVVLNKSDYYTKLQTILDDHSKFKQIKRNPIDKLKTQVNKLITANNAVIDNVKLPKIIGDYKPGYLYGTVKIHKPNSPLRPIISQVTTPIYQLTKTINDLISPYLPSKYSVKSTHELLHILHTQKTDNKITASLDVESLFTNVPVYKTIDIIINNIYNNPSLPPLKIDPEILKKLLLICTTEVPFYDHKGNIYTQIDGVSMGSVLGPTFSNFYMADLENKIFNIITKPSIYARYVDDILILVNSIDEIKKLQDTFQNNSVLKFTHELNVNNKIPFLDVLIDSNSDAFITSPYKKPTSINTCILSFKSECPYRYKIAMVKNLLNRAKLISSSKKIFFNELKNIKQVLINNQFPNYMVDEQIKLMIRNLDNPTNNKLNNSHYINLFYCNQMHPNFKLDEKALKNIIHRYISPTNSDDKIRFIIYYKKMKTSNYVVKNNTSQTQNTLGRTNVIYQFQCPMGECISDNNKKTNSYIGFTSTTLSRRLTLHLSDTSSICQHLKKHNCTPSQYRNILVNNTKIIHHDTNIKKLKILEALYIKTKHPTINNVNYETSRNILKCLA